jgi:transcriptional regulator with XRE-family HTH domain
LEDVIKPLHFTITEAAQMLGVTRKTLSELINGRISLSPEMAIRIGKERRLLLPFGIFLPLLNRKFKKAAVTVLCDMPFQYNDRSFAVPYGKRVLSVGRCADQHIGTAIGFDKNGSLPFDKLPHT